MDRFKAIGDDHGPLARDFVVRDLAKVLQGRTRRDEVLARYADDVFVVLLPETALDSALVLAESLRAKVQGTPFVYQQAPISVTISVGCATLSEEIGSVADLLRHAEGSLEESKRTDGNDICS